jgi:hypothetical protein
VDSIIICNLSIIDNIDESNSEFELYNAKELSEYSLQSNDSIKTYVLLIVIYEKKIRKFETNIFRYVHQQKFKLLYSI